jgi:hypothetical protein
MSKANHNDARDFVHLGLLFDAVKDQCRILDQRCEDPGLTTFILAIEALAQSGFEQCTKIQACLHSSRASVSSNA